MNEVTKVLCDLIRIPSPSGEEQQVANYIYDYMKTFCDSVSVDSMYNVIATLEGNRPGPNILFNAHIDTVPPGDMKDPFVGKVLDGSDFGEKGNVIYGRGACDDKGGVSSMMVAAKNLSGDRNFPGKLVLIFVTQEENGQAPGTTYALKNLDCKFDVAVLGEGTNTEIRLGHKGKVEFFLDTIGKSAHASNPANGINAISLMSNFIQKYKNIPLPSHEVLGQCSAAITFISCPDPKKSALVPNICSLRFDRRYLPSETVESVYSQVDNILKECTKENNNFQYNLEINYVMPPYYIEKDSHYVTIFNDAIKKTKGCTAEFGTWVSGTDGAFIVNDFGIPTIGYGPGYEEIVHTSNEYVPEDHLITATAIYEEFVRTASKKLIYE